MAAGVVVLLAFTVTMTRAAIEIASLIKPRTKPTVIERMMATTIIMSMIGIRLVGANSGGVDWEWILAERQGCGRTLPV